MTYSTGIVYKSKAHDAIEATVAIADCKAIQVAGARAVAIAITESGTVNNRSGAFTVYGSVDGGTTYVALSFLISNAANSNSQTTPTHVASITRNSAGSDLVFLDPAIVGALTHIKIVPTITDAAAPTGNFTVNASIAY